MSSMRSDSIAARERRAVITTAELLALGVMVVVVCWLCAPNHGRCVMVAVRSGV